jgi:hypothetical protein
VLGLEREAAEVDATGLAHDEAVPPDAELGTVESEHLARHRRLEGVVPGRMTTATVGAVPIGRILAIRGMTATRPER